MSKIILVADNNEIVRREICTILLRETDCEVCGEAEHGLDAIEKAQRLHPNLIMLDLSMPVMNGIDAARALRAKMPNVPIIMFTSYADFMMDEMRHAGVTEVVSKSDIFLLILKARILLRQNAA
jgi:DNA-binding NarL/FixJ family response regulator